MSFRVIPCIFHHKAIPFYIFILFVLCTSRCGQELQRMPRGLQSALVPASDVFPIWRPGRCSYDNCWQERKDWQFRVDLKGIFSRQEFRIIRIIKLTIDQRVRLRFDGSEVLERGEGSWVFTIDGEKYLDFSTGTGHWIFESLLLTSHQRWSGRKRKNCL